MSFALSQNIPIFRGYIYLNFLKTNQIFQYNLVIIFKIYIYAYNILIYRVYYLKLVGLN